MKTAICRLLPVALVLSILLICGLACNGDETSESPTEGNGTESKVLETMKRTYADLTNFGFVDVATTRDDPNLEPFYDLSYENWGLLGTYELDTGKITEMTLASYPGGLWITPPFVMLRGQFDLDSLRELLTAEDYSRRDYQRMELWEIVMGDYEESVAIMDDIVMIGNTEAVANSAAATFSNKPSLYDDIDFSDVVKRLPDGINIATRQELFLGEYKFEGLLVSGFAVVKKSDTIVELTWVVNFISSEAAESAFQEMKSRVQYHTSFDFSNVTATQEEQFVEIVAEIPLADYFGVGPPEDEETRALREEMRGVQLAVVLMMTNAGVNQLDAVYDEIDTEEELRGVTASDGAVSLHEFVQANAYPFKQSYVIAVDGTVTVE